MNALKGIQPAGTPDAQVIPLTPKPVETPTKGPTDGVQTVQELIDGKLKYISSTVFASISKTANTDWQGDSEATNA